MKILVFAHQLEVGGTQTNAIEISAALRDFYGYEVLIFATPGPMVKLVEEKGLRFIPAPEPHGHPSPARMRVLREVVRHERPDLLHVWDWYQCLDAYFAVHLPMRIPMVVTDMMMSLTRMLPKCLPTTFGIPELLDRARSDGWRRLEFIPPPIDVNLNAPGAVNPRPFRERYGMEHNDITLVIVSRLSTWMKAESLLRTIDVVRTLGRDIPLRLVIVGEGLLSAKLERLAEEINFELGRHAVVLTGVLLDPRPAYASADIVIGMGGSALRGMAFSKPVVIVGERGFSAPLKPETAELFYHKGIYGLGDGGSDNRQLITDIRRLADHPDQRFILGKFSRQFVVQHFSLETVCERLAEFFRSALREAPRFHSAAVDGLRTAAICLKERSFLPDGHIFRRRIRFWHSNA
jgi:glycosyltransferase involved in cell wall biosynthesis